MTVVPVMSNIVPDHSIRISIDRGGTFSDVHVSYTDPQDPTKRLELITKLLSQDPSNYRDAPTEGCRRVLEMITGESIPRGVPLPTQKIECVRLSTTVATNALLERKGAKHALLITKGFKDLLSIGNQARPRIFDLNIKKPGSLYSDVVEVDERVTLVGFATDPLHAEHKVQFGESGEVIKAYSGNGAQANLAETGARIVKGLSGEAVHIIKPLDEDQVRQDLIKLYEAGYRSLAVVLAHSYTYQAHELRIGEIAKEIGFTQVSLSSQLLAMVRMVPRGVSTTADAYLTPVLSDYLNGFYQGFEGGKDGDLVIEFMGSDGGLVDLKNFSGLKSILSGPAGGVVGFAKTSYDPKEGSAIIGFDVGGTSTDVSRYCNKYEMTYESTIAQVPVRSPQLDINTVAAGGGSRLLFRNGLLQAGPESAGAHPGPICYRKAGGVLALTDANLVLGRLVPKYFPKCFGPNENEALDPLASERAFIELNARIKEETGSEMTLDEMVFGFVTIANETMSRPIRTLTEARGLSTAKHILASFGGAGGQHATEIAENLGINRVLIHRYSSILSAYGLAMADRVYELQEPCSSVYESSTTAELYGRLDALATKVTAELERQGFSADRIKLDHQLHMRFDGSDTALMISAPDDGSRDFRKAFEEAYEVEFGFLLETNIIVDDVKVKGAGQSFSQPGPSVFDEVARLPRSPVDTTQINKKVSGFQKTFVSPPGSTKGSRVDTPIVELKQLEAGDVIEGPALVIDETQTIFINATWTAVITDQQMLISRPALVQEDA